MMSERRTDMNPILKEVPLSFETERLTLRAPLPQGDGRVVNEAINRSLNELKPWLGFAQVAPTVEETEINLREAYVRFRKREAFRYLIFHKESGELIGSTGFHNVDWEVPKGEIGYWVDTKHGGAGYITEAVKGLTELALSHIGFRRVEIRCESMNVKSRAIPEKLGYELEGILRSESPSVDGTKLTDTCIYSTVR